MDNELLVKSIKNICQINNISVSQLENKLGFSPSLISRWNKTSPSLDKIVDIADYFHVSLDEVVGRTLTPKNNLTTQFIDRLYKATELNQLNWENCSEKVDDLQDDENIAIEDGGYQKSELFIAQYNNGSFWLYSQYDKNKGVIEEIDVQIFIQPEKNINNLVIQEGDEEKLNNLWLYLHTKFYGTLDEIKAEELKNIFMQKSFDPLEEYKDNPEILKQVYDKVFQRDPQVLEVINKLNTSEFQKLQEMFSNPEFRKSVEYANKVAKTYKDLYNK